MTAQRPAPGSPVIVQWRKWDGRPHWRNEAVYLGSDRWGEWLGLPVGARTTRPPEAAAGEGSFAQNTPSVMLIAPSGDWVLTVNRDHPHIRVYIDLGWDIRWSEDRASVTGIDMDLDVVRTTSGERTWVDDRDEWEEHSAEYGYTPDVRVTLEALALDLEQRVRAAEAPFDDATADPWLDRTAALAAGAHDGDT